MSSFYTKYIKTALKIRLIWLACLFILAWNCLSRGYMLGDLNFINSGFGLNNIITVYTVIFSCKIHSYSIYVEFQTTIESK